MEVVGRLLTKAEVEKVLHPFGGNSGLNWTLEEIAECVTLGDEELKKDKKRSRHIADGLKKLSE